MLNLLVETKNEYTSHLINILTPLIFEGLQSIYKQSLQVADANDILKIFQTFLKRIPKWNQELINKESDRIINSSHSYGWLNDLIKATIKANLVVLMYNPTVKEQASINPNYYKDVKIPDFIHKIYIECAREFWNNPYLLYHNYPPIDIKRNQRECMNIIKDCIKEAIRKLLPVKHILHFYLGEDIIQSNPNDDFNKVMSEAEEKNLEKMIKKDLLNDKNTDNYNTPQVPNSNIIAIPNKVQSAKSNTEEKTIGTKILNIIDNKNNNDDIVSSTSSSNSNKIEKNESKKTESKKTESKKEYNSTTDKSIDEKMKQLLAKDLVTDSDLETSLNYNQKYQEVFSNSNEVNENKDNSKLFSNYLQF